MFNAIEPLWKTLKRKISPEVFEGKDHFKQFVTNTFQTYPNASASPTTGSKHSSRIFKSYADHSSVLVCERDAMGLVNAAGLTRGVHENGVLVQPIRNL